MLMSYLPSVVIFLLIWIVGVYCDKSVMYPYGSFPDTLMGCPNDDLPYGLIHTQRGLHMFGVTHYNFYISVNGYVSDIPSDSWTPQRFPLNKATASTLTNCTFPDCLMDYDYNMDVIQEISQSNKDPDPCLNGRELVNNSGPGEFEEKPFDYTYSVYNLGCMRYVFDVTSDLPNWMIALFWHDIDNRVGNGAFYYRETVDIEVLKQATDDISRLGTHVSFTAKWAFVITFEEVTFFYGQNYLYPGNTMQLVIATDGIDAYSVNNFGKMTWGGGQIGFDSGTGSYCALRGSRSLKVIQVEHTSNIGIPGRWVMKLGADFDRDICEPQREYLPSCVCENGWEGVLCGSSIDDCIIQPCDNGATCHDGHMNRTCECAFGYMGVNCSEVDYCANVTCHYNGTCHNVHEDFMCECINETSGRTCEHYDHCYHHPCDHGKCTNLGHDFQCACPDIYKGKRCEVLDYCLINDCTNGATCNGDQNGFTCACKDGWTKRRCDTVDYCFGNNCTNGATCINGESNYTCNCASGFIDRYCDVVDHCYNVTCQNGGQCMNLPESGTFQCDCVTRWTGIHCEKVDYCVDADCTGNTVCENGDSNHTCICKDGWTGDDCNDIDYCYYNATQCLNGATCVNNKTDLQCVCPVNYTGQFCHIFDHCSQSYVECSNDSSCRNTGSSGRGYTCDCHVDWYGENCALDDPCNSSPCMNSGTCKFFRLYKTYRCRCPKGYKGPQCQTVDVRSISRFSKQQAPAPAASTGILAAVGAVAGVVGISALLYTLVRRMKKKNGDRVSPEPKDEMISDSPVVVSGKNAMVTGHV